MAFVNAVGYFIFLPGRYVPFFLSLLLYYTGCFQPAGQADTRYKPAWWLLLIFSAVYYW